MKRSILAIAAASLAAPLAIAHAAEGATGPVTRDTTPPAATAPQGTQGQAGGVAPTPGTAAQAGATGANGDAVATTGEDRSALHDHLQADAADAPDRASAETRTVAVSDLEGMDVYNARDERLGDVGEVVVGPGDRQYVVITDGGLLGIGEDRLALPLERVWLQNDRLVVHGITESDLSEIDGLRADDDNYERVDGDQQATVPVLS